MPKKRRRVSPPNQRWPAVDREHPRPYRCGAHHGFQHCGAVEAIGIALLLVARAQIGPKRVGIVVDGGPDFDQSGSSPTAIDGISASTVTGNG